MATLNQITERIAYALNSPLNTLLKENLKFSVKGWRATLIRRDLSVNGNSDEFLQKIKIDLIKVNKTDDCLDIDCNYILRSKYKIPKPLRLKADVNFKFVGVLDNDDNLKPATYVEQEEVRYTKYNTFTSKVLRYNYTNGYVYFYNNTLLKKAIIHSIFADPREVNTACDEECYNDDMEYPMSEDMITAMISAILKGEFILQNPVDEEVNIESDNTQPNK